MNTNIETKTIRIEDIKPNPKNPKKHWVEKISESIKEMGYIEPIILDENNMILAGHGRLKALKENKVKEVEIIVKRGLTEKQKEKYMLLSNKLVEAGGWDLGLLKRFDESLLLDSAFNNEDMDEIFGLEIDEEFDIEQKLKEVLKEGPKRVKDGDIWQLGDHKLLIGDCVNKENWEKLLGQERFDFLFCDPPYKLFYGQRMRKIKTSEGIKLKKDKVYESVGITDKKGRFKGWVKTKNGFGYRGQRSYLGVEKRGGIPEYDEWLSIADEFQNPKGANVMIFENWKNTVELWQAIEKYWKIRNQIIWFLPNRCQGYSKKHFFFNKYDICPLAGNGILNEEYEEELESYLKEKGQKLLDTYEVALYGQKNDSYWSKNKGTRWAKVNDHITWTADTGKSSEQQLIFGTKPVQVLISFVKILSPRNGLVMDCFAGSGSTIIASEIMKRRCRAIEIEPIYAEIILARWEKLTGRKAKKL